MSSNTDNKHNYPELINLTGKSVYYKQDPLIELITPTDYVIPYLEEKEESVIKRPRQIKSNNGEPTYFDSTISKVKICVVGLPPRDGKRCYLVKPNIYMAVRAFSDERNRNDITTYSETDVQRDGSVVCSKFIYANPHINSMNTVTAVTHFINSNFNNTAVMTGSRNLYVTKE